MTTFSRIEALEEQSRYKEGIYYNLPTNDPARHNLMSELKVLEKTILRLKTTENENARLNGQMGIPYPDIDKSYIRSKQRDSFICGLL